MMPTLDIIFQNHLKVFSPGETVSGYVEADINKPISCKTISIKILGVAQVNFQDRGTIRTTHSQDEDFLTGLVDYFSNEEYYSISYKLWGNGINYNKLTAGRRQFQFSFVLPTHIPSSFESQFGFVKHTCEASMDIASPNGKTVTFSSPISVVARYDLNNDPLSLNPISLKKEKVLYNLLFKSGPISFTVNIDRSGYVPGESIIINAVCSNKSNKEMLKSRAEIVQKIQFKAEGKTKNIENVVCFKEHSKLPAGGDNIWDSEPLLIPNLPPSHLPGCNIIDVQYMFVFLFVPSGVSFTLEARNDLVIGTIPLHNFLNMTSSSAHQTNFLDSQIREPTFQPPYMPYNDMPNASISPTYPGHLDGASAPPVGFDGLETYPPFPPSYEESMRGSKAATLEDFQYEFSDDEDEKLSHKSAYPNLN